MKQLAVLKAIAFHLQSINKSQKDIASRMNTADAFERGMKAGYEITTESVAPYIEELNKIVADLSEAQPYLIDDLTYEEVHESA